MLNGIYEIDDHSLGITGKQSIARTQIRFDTNGRVEYFQQLPNQPWQSLGKGTYYQDLKRLSIHMGKRIALYEYEVLGDLLAMRPLMPKSVLKRSP